MINSTYPVIESRNNRKEKEHNYECVKLQFVFEGTPGNLLGLSIRRMRG